MLRLATITGLAIVAGAGFALAAQGTSGRPGAILDPSQCYKVCSKAVKDGSYVKLQEAGPYIVNFKLVDQNKNGKITKSEWKAACNKGLVQYAQN
jgi:hypothetical protein